VKLQAQAVLRRPDQQAPLRLAGVLLAGSFYPLTAQDAWGPLHLEVGLVALAPLTPIIAPDADAAVSQAMAESRDQWTVAGAGDGERLSWIPIDRVRDATADEDVRALIAAMTTANEERAMETPSTPAYDRAARELERLAGLVYEATSAAERVAEDGALRASSASAIEAASKET